MLRRKPIKKKTPAEKRARTLRKRRLGKEAVARSAVRKGPARDEAHLAKVRACRCLLSSDPGGCVAGPVEAHHCRHIAPRTLGKRVSDYLTVPLCQDHHRLLHTMNEDDFWDQFFFNPRFFIRSFTKEGAAELERADK